MRALVILLMLCGVARANDPCPRPPERNYHRLTDAHWQDFKMSAAMTNVGWNCTGPSDTSQKCRVVRERCLAQKREFDAAGQAMHSSYPFDADIAGGWLGEKYTPTHNLLRDVPASNQFITCSASKERMHELANARSDIASNHWSLANEWLRWHAWATRVSKKCEAKERRDEQERERLARQRKAKLEKEKRERERKLALEKQKREQEERARKEKERRDKARKDRDKSRTARQDDEERAKPTKTVFAAEDVKDCRYWDARIRDARTCAARSRYRGRNTEASESSGPCDARVSYYVRQRSQCVARQSVAAAPGGPARPRVDYLAPLAEAAQKLGELGHQHTRANISMLQRAAAQLKAYEGAQQITEDPLAGLGLEFADINEVAKAQGSWHGAPLSWELPAEQRHSTVHEYCHDVSRSLSRQCKHRCDQYWSDLESPDPSRACAADRFAAHFDDQLMYCEGWCDERAMSYLRQCVAESKLVETPDGGRRIEPCACHESPGLPPREPRSCPRADFP